MQMREKVGKSRNTVFPMIWGSGGSKSRLAKAASAEPSSQMRDEKCTPLWREAHFEVKMYTKHTMLGPLLKVEMSKKCTLFWVRSTFPSQNVQNTPGSEHFWKLRRHLKRICKDAFSVAGAVQETSSSELLGGPGAGFLRGVAFWSLRSSVLGRWFCVTGAALGMTWLHFFVAGAVL